MFNRFTERARKVIVYAKEEARRFNHDYIGTEHLLLGLVREGEGVERSVALCRVEHDGSALGYLEAVRSDISEEELPQLWVFVRF